MDGRRTFWLASTVLAAATATAGGAHSLHAQWNGMMPSGRFELSEAVEVDQVDVSVRANWIAKALLADRQWDEAIEILRQLSETSEGKLLAVGPHRFVGLRDWCQLRLAALPPPALKLYRGRVDSVAQKWCEQGIAGRDRKLLQNVVDRAFASSFGDRALMALGEMSLESGDYAAARWNWERIVPVKNRDASAAPPAWPSYPDTNLDLAAVRARLVLVSILEGAADRARSELAAFRRLHPDAQGRLGGREGKYVELLESLLAESASWPAAPSETDWLTFAGNSRRNEVAAPLVDVGAVAWRVALRRPPPLPKVRRAPRPAAKIPARS